MALIYIQREDFSLKRNKNLIEVLEYNNISKFLYTSNLLPFINTISGQFYFAKGPQLKNKLGLPQLAFNFNKLSLIELIEFLENPFDNELNIPIQDRKSMILEKNQYFVPPGISEGPSYAVAVKSYKKQIGNIQLSFEKTAEINTNIHLDKIIDTSAWVVVESSENINRRTNSILMG